MKKILILTLLTTFLSSCASLAKPLLPLKSRTLYIDTEKAILYSTYKTCKGFIFKKCKLNRIEYDFSKKDVRVKLKATGFKLKVTR